jgi:flagellar basal-body rod protein FlgC
MQVEKVRLDVTSLNIANIHSTRSSQGTAFSPLYVLSAAKSSPRFHSLMAAASPSASVAGAEVVEIRPSQAPPRLVYEPAHPDANEKGFVAYPGINPVSEMVNLISTMRAYEANVAALNVAKAMALKALELGGNG